MSTRKNPQSPQAPEPNQDAKSPEKNHEPSKKKKESIDKIEKELESAYRDFEDKIVEVQEKINSFITELVSNFSKVDSKPIHELLFVIYDEEFKKICKILCQNESDRNKFKAVRRGYLRIFRYITESSSYLTKELKVTPSQPAVVMDLLQRLYSVYSLLESFKRLYRQLNTDDSPDKKLDFVKFFALFCFIEDIHGIGDSSDSDSTMGKTARLSTLKRFISEHEVEYFQFKEFSKFLEPLFKGEVQASGSECIPSQSHHSENEGISNLYPLKTNILVTILEYKDLSAELIVGIFKVIFYGIKNPPDFGQAYSASHSDSNLRDECDKILAVSIKNKKIGVVQFLANHFKLKFKMPDLLRICALEFKKPCRFDKGQKEIIVDLLLGSDAPKNTPKRKGRKNKKQSRNQKQRSQNKEREGVFLEFVRQFNGEVEASNSDAVPFQSHGPEENDEDKELKKTIENEAVVNVQQELGTLLDKVNGYPGFNLKGKLDALADQLSSEKKVEANPEEDNKKSPHAKALEHFEKFREILEGFFKYTPKPGIPGNCYANACDQETWDFLNACAQINTLSQLVEQWQKEGEVIAEQATKTVGRRKLSTEAQRQCKRFLYLRHIWGLLMRQLTTGRWPCVVRHDGHYVLLRAPSDVAQKAVSLSLLWSTGSDLTVRGSSLLAYDTYTPLAFAHSIRLHTKATKKKNTPRQSLFGKLCRAAFIKESPGDVGRAVTEILQANGEADADADQFSWTEKLAVCFFMTCPGAVNLPSDIKKILKNDASPSEEALPLKSQSEVLLSGSLPVLDVKEPDIPASASDWRTTWPSPPLSEDSTTHSDEQKASLPVVRDKHPLLAYALAKKGEVSCPLFLTGTSAGLLLLIHLSKKFPHLWPNAEENFLTYFGKLGGDFDFLTTSSPAQWGGLRETRLKGLPSDLYEWTLWKSSDLVSYLDPTDPTGTPFPLPLKLDVVHIQRGKEAQGLSDEALIERYKKEGGCVSTLGSFVLRIVDHKTGAYELVFGDWAEFEAQLHARALGFVYPEQLEESLRRFESKRIEEREINTVGLKVLKFFNNVDCLNALCAGNSPFGIEPRSLALMVKYQTVIGKSIRLIGYFRKRSFHNKIFGRRPPDLESYLRLLHTLGFLRDFLMRNTQEVLKGKNNTRDSEYGKSIIEQYEKSVETLVYFLTIDTVKGVSNENVRTYLAMEQIFSSPKPFFSTEAFLNAIGAIYRTNQDRESANLFDKEREEYLAFIKNKRNTLLNGLLGHQALVVPGGKSVFSVLSKCELVPELTRKEFLPSEQLSFLMAGQHEILRNEINAQIKKSLASHSKIENMPKVSLAEVARNRRAFSVNIDPEKNKQATQYIEAIKQTLAVFYVRDAENHYVFSGVFEDAVDTEDAAIEIRVFAQRDTVNLLASLLRKKSARKEDVKLHFSVIAPCLGMVYEWMAMESLKKDPYQSPILKTLLLPASPSRSIIADIQENAALIPGTLNLRQREAMTQVLRSVDEVSGGATEPQVTVIKGPPGTGKTKFICELAKALQTKGVPVLIVTHSNEAARHIMSALLRDYPQVRLVGKVRLDSRPEQMIWSLDKLKDCVVKALKGMSSVKSISEGIARLNELKRRVGQTMPLFSCQMHTIIDRLICEMTEQRSITQEMISGAKAKFIALFSRRSADMETAILATANVMVGTLHGLAAHHKTRAVLGWRSGIEPGRTPFFILDEASQASWPSVLPMLLEENVGMAIVGDPRQLEPTTHSQSPPGSILTTCLRNIDPSRVIGFEETYRADPAITQLWSDLMYQGCVISALPKARQGLYAELRRRLSESVPYLSARPLTLVDVADGRQARCKESYKNVKEGQSVVTLGLDLLSALGKLGEPWLEEEGIWVLVATGYRGQLEEINRQLGVAVKKRPEVRALLNKLKVVTIDGSQGQEALYTLICTTRAQPASKPRGKKRGGGALARQQAPEEERGRIGHAVETRRLNVALSRGQCGVLIFVQLALFDEVTQGIKAKVVEALAALSETQGEEGLFIKRSPPSTDEEKQGGELNCLARGYHGKQVWCRLHARHDDDKDLQVEVLSEKDGASIETLSVPGVSLSKIHTEDPETLTVLKCCLLRLLSAGESPYLSSSVSWRLLLELFRENLSESSTILSSKVIMGR